MDSLFNSECCTASMLRFHRHFDRENVIHLTSGIFAASLLFTILFKLYAFSAYFGLCSKYAEKAYSLKRIIHAFGVRRREWGERSLSYRQPNYSLRGDLKAKMMSTEEVQPPGNKTAWRMDFFCA